MKKRILLFAVLVCSISVAFAGETTKPHISFNPDGTINRPQNYRQWVNVGTTLAPMGAVNIIDRLPIKSAEFLDTYVEPNSFEIYMKSGVWPNGSQIVKEFTATKPGSSPGEVVESHYTGLSLIIKDMERFPAETAHLGFFQFGHNPEPYTAKASLMPRNRCSACHEKNASYQQNIFADRHIGLN